MVFTNKNSWTNKDENINQRILGLCDRSACFSFKLRRSNSGNWEYRFSFEILVPVQY